MDPSPEAFSDPFGSFPLPDPTIILGDTDVEASSPTRPFTNHRTTPRTFPVVFPSSNATLDIPLLPLEFSANTHRPSRPNGKRGASPTLEAGQSNKTPRISPNNSKTPRGLILEARDLIVQACTLEKSRDEQSKLLDLLEVFREFTEKGRLQSASSIIASQVSNLETATRQFETKVRALAKPSVPATSQNPSANNHPKTTPHLAPAIATVAAAGASKNSGPQEWTIVEKKNKGPKQPAPSSSNRLILIKPPTDRIANFSPLATRNAFNKAFLDRGIQGPVVALVSKSLGQNLVVTTTSAFSADFLLEKQAIWEHVIPFETAQKDEPWHKVALHGVPTPDFNKPEGMALVIEEIRTFNKGLKPIGSPYWLTSAEKRATQRAGSVAVAFATKEEADRAIQNRLYIAGISVRVEKLYSTAPTTQCQNCQGFGHLENHCKKRPVCRFCGENHATQQHHCNSCRTKGAKCQHLAPKCGNCNESHTADYKSCEVLLAIKRKGSVIQM